MPIHVTLSPWFHGVDCAFEFIAVIVALLLTFYAFEIYRFSKVREYKFFALAFLCIAGSFVFKILTHVSVHIVSIQHLVLGVARLALHTPYEVHIAFLFTVAAWRGLFLAGLLLYYALLDKTRNKRQLFLSLYLAGVVALLSFYKQFMFYITAAIILLFIVHILYVNSRRRQTKYAWPVILAFLLILSAQVTFLFVSVHTIMYPIGQVLQLLGFGLLLVNYLLMRRESNESK